MNRRIRKKKEIQALMNHYMELYNEAGISDKNSKLLIRETWKCLKHKNLNINKFLRHEYTKAQLYFGNVRFKHYPYTQHINQTAVIPGGEKCIYPYNTLIRLDDKSL